MSSNKTYQSPSRAPEYRLHRFVESADVADDTEQMHGMLMQDARWANIQVIPVNGANPDFEVMFWSEEAGKFISSYTPLTFSGMGVNTPFEFTVEVNGRRIWVKVPSLSSGSCKIYVSSFNTNQR